MAVNYNSLGDNVTFELGDAPTPSSGAIKSGAFVKQGDIWGVALANEFVDNADDKRKVVVATEGVWILKVTGTYSFGASVYFASGTGLTFTAEDNGIPVGVAVGTDPFFGASMIKVRIQQTAKAATGKPIV